MSVKKKKRITLVVQMKQASQCLRTQVLQSECIRGSKSSLMSTLGFVLKLKKIRRRGELVQRSRLTMNSSIGDIKKKRPTIESLGLGKRL